MYNALQARGFASEAPIWHLKRWLYIFNCIQPSIDIPPLWHSILRKEKRKKTKRRSHNNKINKQDKRGMEKREKGRI
jgi:NADH:ubiquinone oxidoreductase subunit